MAGSSIIGALRVVLGMDSAALDKGLKDAQGGLKSFAAGASKIAAGIGLEKLIESAVDGFVHAVKRGFEAADELGKSAQKIGIPVEELSKLKYAAELSDVSMQQLEKGVGKLSQAMAQMAGGAVNDSTRAMKAMGITAQDAAGSTTELFAKLAANFESTKDSAGKTALAMQLFGKSGKDLIPLLNSGAEGLKAMYEEAEKLGLVFSKETVAATTHFNDDMKTMQRVLTGLSNQVVAGLAPAFAVLLERFKEYVKNADLIKGVSQGALNWFMNLWEIVGTLSLGIERLTGEFSGFKTMMSAFNVPINKFSETWSKGWKEQEDAVKKYDTGIANLKGILQQFVVDVGTKTAEWVKEVGKGHNDAATGIQVHKDALDKFIESQQKSLASQQANFLADGMATGAKERMKVIQEGLVVASQMTTKATEEQTAKLIETANAAELLGLKLGNVRLIGETNPFAPIVANLEATNLKLAEGGLKIEDYNLLTEQSGKLQQKIWSQSAASVGDSFASMGNSLSQMSDNWARLAKIGQAIGATIAFVNSYIAASEAFAKTPFPANIALAAGVLAKGLVMVSAIKSAVVPKFATGGTIQVGGTGGVDSVPFSGMVSPGERVHVEQNKYGERGDGGPRTPVTINVPAPSLDMIRSLLNQMQGVIKNGYVFNVKPA